MLVSISKKYWYFFIASVIYYDFFQSKCIYISFLFFVVFISAFNLSHFLGHWFCWGLTTRQPLWVILCHLQEKGRREIEEIVEEMKERDRGERKMDEREETEEIISFPLYPNLLQG